MGRAPASIFLSLFAMLARILGILSLVVVVLFLLPLVVPYVRNATSYPYVKSALHLERTINADVRSLVPMNIGGRNMTRRIVIFGMLILSWIFGRIRHRFFQCAVYLDQKKNLEKWKTKMRLPLGGALSKKLNLAISFQHTMQNLGRIPDQLTEKPLSESTGKGA